MRYEVLSSIVPYGPYETYDKAVETIESYGLKEHLPYSPWSGPLYVEVKGEHYWKGAYYWRSPALPCCHHIAYIIPEGAKEVRSRPSWDDELPEMKRYVGECEKDWLITTDELKKAFAIGAVDFSTGYDNAPTCVIGKEWFYFAGHEGEGMSWQEYRDSVGIDEMLREVADILNNPIAGGIDCDESINAIFHIRKELEAEWRAEEEQRRKAERAKQHKLFLKNLQRYTDDELIAEIERRKASQED